MRILVLIAVVLGSLGCGTPPPTATAVIAKEPTKLFWGDAQALGDAAPEERTTDFAIVTASAASEGVSQASWVEVLQAADAEYAPCVFTSFPGWQAAEGGSTRTVFVEEGAEAPPAEDDAVELVGLPSEPPTSALRPPNDHLVDTRAMIAAWAVENTRTSIFSSFERSEVYATTGARIRLRFFGGWEFNRKMSNNTGMVRLGYMFGHPMGSELRGDPKGYSPKFMVYAIADPEGGLLERIQIVKGWVAADGALQEQTYDVIRATAFQIEQMKRRKRRSDPPPSTEPGVPAMHGFWIDPDFDPSVPAYYVMQAYELPGPGGATALPGDGVPRAYTAPIWYLPAEKDGP